MPIITGLAATTELEAVNAMLAAIGEQPLAPGTNLASATQGDVLLAINVLTDTTRKVQAMGWRFNTEFGYGLAPVATYAWVDTDGVTTPLSIFTPPANLLAFEVQAIPEQIGCNEVDAELRRSRKYSAGTTVFYDRSRSRDGFPAAAHPYLYINPTWFVAFEDMPESARSYVAMKAARIFVENAVGSYTLSQFSIREEQIALRTLAREQGTKDRYNLLSAAAASAARGHRPGRYSGGIDPRRNRQST